MKQELRVGIVIADEQEYKPMEAVALKYEGNPVTLFGYAGHSFSLTRTVGERVRKITVKALRCGIGMVNAAAATAFLLADGADLIINTGLSGGFGDIRPGEITVGTRFVEHDFDLTVLGYKPAEKPGQNYIYTANQLLCDLLMACVPQARLGVMASGDCFVSDSKTAAYLIETFGALSCDMESAAAASVCARARRPFAAVRQISDGGNETAATDYNEVNARAEDTLVSIVMQMIDRLFQEEGFFAAN